jgi:RNA polymerase sigma factor (TIGR02999 family)
MTENKRQKVTQILSAASSGNQEAAKELWDFVYDELRKLASRKMAHTPPGQTLQPTALVHEAYLRLVGDQEQQWENRAHFFGAAARAMRNVLVDQVRKKGRIKRGGQAQRIPFSQIVCTSESQPLDILALDEALKRLEKDDPRLVEVALLRFFAGLTIEETAKAMGVSTSTVEREWSYARAWLYREIKKGDP